MYRDALGVTVPAKILAADLFQLTAHSGNVLRERCDALKARVGKDLAAEVRLFTSRHTT